MIVTKILKRIKPHFLFNQKIICSKNNKIIEYDEKNNSNFLFELQSNWFDRIFFKSKILSRLLRIGIRSSIHYKNNFFFSYKKSIYSYEIKKKLISHEHNFRYGRGPLNFTVIDNLNNFEDGVIFGEYFGNNQRKEINIYKRNEHSDWKIIYTFKKGTLNHIHSIIVDRYRDCLWVLAGDFEYSSSIWKIRNNFKLVEKIVFDDQIYRSCYAYPTKDGLIYATDTQFIENSIRLLKVNNESVTSEEMFKINGTCIYACELKDYIIFSTSTEPKHHVKNKFLMYFDNRPGRGIKDNKSDIIVFNKKSKNFSIIASLKKDCLPYGLFGIGTIMFPNNTQTINTIYAFTSGSKINDQDTMILNIKP